MIKCLDLLKINLSGFLDFSAGVLVLDFVVTMLGKNKLLSFLVGCVLASNCFAQVDVIEDTKIVCSSTRKGESFPFLTDIIVLYKDGTYNLAQIVKDPRTNKVINPLSAQYFGSFSLVGGSIYLRSFLKVPDGERVEKANDPVWFSSPAPQGFYWKIKDHNNGAISISQHTPITGAYTECSGRFIRYLDENSRASADMLRQQKNAAMSKYGYKAFGR